MKKDILDQGKAGVGFIDPSNDNFKEIYQIPSNHIQRFLSKVTSNDSQKSDIVRVSIWADSIWNSYTSTFENQLISTFPNKTFEFKHAQLGGTGSDYQSAMVYEVINFNPDLIVVEEWESFKLTIPFETLLKSIKQKTSADVLLNPFPISGAAMDLLSNKDIDGFKANGSYMIREYFYSIAAKYNCGIYDWDLQVIKDLYDGVVTRSQLTADGTHRTAYFETTYAPITFETFFDNLYNNPSLSQGNRGSFNKSIHLVNELNMSDMSESILSGSWSEIDVDTDKSFGTIESNQIGDYCEFNINGIGFELAAFGLNSGSVDVLIDGVAPSTIIKDYATCARDYLTGLHKIIVDDNILSNNEVEREFKVTMTSATQYTLEDITNATTLGTGKLITQDEVFSVTDGQLTIPAYYAGSNNWRGTIASGQIYTFSVKKNWYDNIGISNDNLTNTVRLFGLKKENHTIRLTVNSGTVNLDSILEL